MFCIIREYWIFWNIPERCDILVIRHLLRRELLLQWYLQQQRVRVRVMIGCLLSGRVRIKIRDRVRVKVMFNVGIYHRSICRTFDIYYKCNLWFCMTRCQWETVCLMCCSTSATRRMRTSSVRRWVAWAFCAIATQTSCLPQRSKTSTGSSWLILRFQSSCYVW